MKSFTPFFLMCIFAPSLLFSQGEQQPSKMEIMATVVTTESLEAIDLVVNISEGDTGSSIQFSPDSEKSGLIIISGRPFSKFRINIPAETHLINQYGEEAFLIDYHLISGPERDTESMEIISPSECSELSIPESGQLFIKVGGIVESEEPLRGIYTGILSLECGE